MRLVGHIVRKDFYRLRWIIALWVSLIGCAMMAAFLQARMDPATYMPFYSVALILGYGPLPLTAFGLVMGLIDDDPVADGDAFWITRPISAAQLFAAKAVSLVLLSLIPVVIALPWWLLRGFDSESFAGAAVRTFQLQIFITFLALPLAVVSRNSSKFVLNVILGAAGMLGLTVGAGLLIDYLAPLNSSGEHGAFFEHDQTVRAVALCWVLGTVAVALNQFFSRRTGRSIALMGLALLAGLASAWWLEMGPVVSAPIVSTHEVPPIRLTIPIGKGSGVARSGHGVEIFDTALAWTGDYEILISETSPSEPSQLLRSVFAAPAGSAGNVSYALVGRTDGRILPVADVTRWGHDLEVAEVTHSHARLTFKPTREWTNDAPSDFSAWVKDAALIKAITGKTIP